MTRRIFVEKIIILNALLLLTLSAQGMQLQLSSLDKEAIKLLAADYVRRSQDPEYARQENAIFFYLEQEKDVNGYGLRRGTELSYDERKKRVREELAQGCLVIGPNGYLCKADILKADILAESYSGSFSMLKNEELFKPIRTEWSYTSPDLVHLRLSLYSEK